MTRAILLAALAAMAVAASGCSFNAASLIRFGTAEPERDRLEQAVDMNPRNAHAWFALGRIELERGDYRDARRAFRRALAADPAFEEAAIGIALASLSRGAYRAAEREYQEALDAFGPSAAALEGLASARLGRGDLEGARLAARQALAADPATAIAHRVLAEAAYIEADYAAALAHWDDASAAGADKMGMARVVDDLRLFVDKYLRAAPEPAR